MNGATSPRLKHAMRKQLVLARGYAIGGAALTGAFLIAQFLAGIAGPGFFGCAWALLCTVAAARRHALAWAVLVLAPLALLCLQWIGNGYPVRIPDQDPFGFEYVTISAFIFASFVAATTGALFSLTIAREGAGQPRMKGSLRQ